MKISDIEGPVYTRDGRIDVTVLIKGKPGRHPHTLDRGSDREAQALSGEFGPIAPYDNSQDAMNDWENKMARLDATMMKNVTRFMEDYLDGNPIELAKKTKEFKDAMVAKKKLRNNQPL